MRPALLACLAAFAAVASARTSWYELSTNYTFDAYAAEFSKSYGPGEYATRKALFEGNLARIMAHNADTTKTWKEGVNQFTDRTTEEFRQLLGYKKAVAYKSRGDGSVKTQLTEEQVKAALAALPSSVDWRTKGAVTPVKNQGQCGSCWTFGSAETLESAYFIKKGVLPILSEQQFASCTSNPQDCGGSGGCEGGTAEVAYATAITPEFNGVASETEYPYLSGGGQDYACKFSNKTTPPVVPISSYVNLPSNEAVPMLTAVATVGPLVINVDASSWSTYESGIYDGCSTTNIDLDHVVQLVGYGSEGNQNYWLVRNSWGPTWGEEGYIRVYQDNPAKPNCAPDTQPQDGSGCNGGPSVVTTCGTCGILYDTCYPVI